MPAGTKDITHSSDSVLQVAVRSENLMSGNKERDCKKVSAFLFHKHRQGKCGRIVMPPMDTWVISWRPQRNSPSASETLGTDPFTNVWINVEAGGNSDHPFELMCSWLHQSRRGEHTTPGFPSPRFYSLINSPVKNHIVLYSGNLQNVLRFTSDLLQKVYSARWINYLKWPILAASKRVLPSVS